MWHRVRVCTQGKLREPKAQLGDSQYSEHDLPEYMTWYRMGSKLSYVSRRKKWLRSRIGCVILFGWSCKDRFIAEARLDSALPRRILGWDVSLARSKLKRCTIAVPKTKDATVNSNRCGTGLTRSANAASTSTLPRWAT